MKLGLADSQQKVPGIAPGMLPGDSRTWTVSEETILGIAHLAQALAYFFLRASFCLYKGFLNSYADLHIFLVQSSGEGIGSAEAWNVDVGLVHGAMLILTCENR